MTLGKTGGQNTQWIELALKPRPVADVEDYWLTPPDELSERCMYWVQAILGGFRPNKRIRRESYYGMAEWFGIYIWELTQIIYPLLNGQYRLAAQHIAHFAQVDDYIPD